uniref:Uncharacterized protein n=1 Tax=viral metagenome TaxID=1070528 RepID=A0A6H2A0T9_9ZZZZ
MKTQLQKDTEKQAADFCGCFPEDFKGFTYKELLTDCERSGAIVFWGFWTEVELKATI